ncbi:MAG: type I DNA topoisomerase [Paraprevotella sp.]|nr:type I DNA topoisomerase [Paraprevotella sp.]
MQKNLVIVESPAKAKTIEKFLGNDFKVLSSYGHIRDLKKKEFSIDTESFVPKYEIPAEKTKLVNELKSQAKKADTVWLASDEDREGEAISWHLFEVLNLKAENTKRIVFHEITKPAILEAIENPRDIDLNLVNAQQARRVLDRIVGFKLSPVLWKKVKPALSAGRVQSVVVRLIVEREREIQNFKGEESYRITAVFTPQEGDTSTEIKAELNQRFKTKEEAMEFLEVCRNSEFRIQEITTRPQKRVPAAPFTTSTLQQEAAHKLNFTVAQTMMVAQRLYESGRITYMRTDSVNLSGLCIGASTKVITELMGEKYVKSRQYQTKSKGAQEAHEAIRPTYMDQAEIEGTPQERRLYDLIWKRTIASQMADAELEKTTIVISIGGQNAQFIATGQVVKFEGFLKVYRESYEEDQEQEDESRMLPPMQQGQILVRKEIMATQRFAQRPPRYNEASLVHKLEELGIGRPSTYATTISTIQQREYVVKSDKNGEECNYTILSLKNDEIEEQNKTLIVGAERGKLSPTDTGTVVNDFLLQFFPAIMDYKFTAEVEKKLDDVAEGVAEWSTVMKDFYDDFEPLVEKTLNVKSEHKVGERSLGLDPTCGKPVYVKIGRFGPVAQIGSADDTEKPRFAQLRKEQSIETITLEEALDLFKFPRNLGELEGHEVTIGAGRFGPYILHNKKYVSIPAGQDPMAITYEEAVNLLMEKRQAETKRHLKTFEEDPEVEVLDGRYGPYICYKGENYRMPKAQQEKASELTLEECMSIIQSQNNKPAKATKTKRTYTRKK